MDWHRVEWLTSFDGATDTEEFFIEITIAGIEGRFVRGPFTREEVSEATRVARADWLGASVTVHHRECLWRTPATTYPPLREEEGDVR